MDIGQDGVGVGTSLKGARGSWGEDLVRVLPVEDTVIFPHRVIVLIVFDLHVVHHVESVLLVAGRPGHIEMRVKATIHRFPGDD